QFRSTELKINDRSIHYLCFGKAVKTTNKYIEKTLHLNRLIKATNKVSLLPPLKVKAQIMKQSLQRLQDMFHILFLKNIGTQKYCSLISKLKIINKPPFLSSALGLKRDSQGAARISSLKWGFDFKSKRGIILKVIFNLKRLGDFKTEEIQNGNSYLSYH
ncbi:MAG: hypothetical protein OEY33_09900, partial [Bdellovibrionales bacterium]|nr:hypothetical protein [Bdellovibrionales bacterium]